jgi:hypothetical protein
MRSPPHLKGDIKRLIEKLGTPSRGPLAYASPDFDPSMYLVGHCNLILIVVTLSLQQLLGCTICAYMTRHHSVIM